MKKFVLVMFCALLVLVFIALNYLLWDRENKVRNIESLESSNASNKASIDVLGREIKRLEDEKKLLEEKLSQLENENSRLNLEIDLVKQEVSETEKKLAKKLALIDKLKETADLSKAEEPVRKWVEAVNNGEYENAYRLMLTQMENQGGVINLVDFTDSYKKSIKSMELKSIELYAGDVPENSKGNIIFKVSLEVIIADNNLAGGIWFDEGLNERYIAMDYNEEKDEWVIASIASTPMALN